MLFWQACDLIRPWNNARKDIKWKMDASMTGDIGGFWFAETNKILGSVMAGYDGHRGSVDYSPVLASFQQLGFGRELMRKVKQGLTFAGCLKINLLIRKGNKALTSSHERLDYFVDLVVALSRRLINDH